MPTLEEQSGRALSGGRIERTYLVCDAADELTAEAFVLAHSQVPTAFGTRDQRNATARESTSKLEEWTVTVEWAEPGTDDSSGGAGEEEPGGGNPSTPTDPPVYTFSTQGSTALFVQSLQTVGTYAASGGPPAPDFNQGIGWNGTNFEGVQVTTPAYAFGETHALTVAQGNALKSTLYNVTGAVNSGAFRGFAADEVLCLGATGRQQGINPWSIALAFAAAPNLTGLSAGSITGIAKKGWEYLWALYEKQDDATAKFITPKIRAAYVERVYRRVSFAGLPAA